MEEQTKCDSCEALPQNYVKLECQHKLCLLCLAYAFLEQNQMENELTFTCTQCNQPTDLDDETLTALQIVIQEVIIPQSKENEPAPLSSEQDNEIKVNPWNQSALSQDYSPKKDQQEVQISQLFFKLQQGETYLTKLNKTLDVKYQNLSKLQNEKLTFQMKCQEMKEQILREFQQLEKQLTVMKAEFLQQMNKLEQNYMKHLKDNEDQHEQDITQILNLKDGLNLSLNKSSDSDLFDKLLKDIDFITSQNRMMKEINYFDQMAEITRNKNQFVDEFNKILNFRSYPSQNNNQPISNNISREFGNLSLNNTSTYHSLNVASFKPQFSRTKPIKQLSYIQEYSPLQQSRRSPILEEIGGSKNSFNNKFSPAKSNITLNSFNVRKSNKINWKSYLDTLMDKKKGSTSSRYNDIYELKRVFEPQISIQEALTRQHHTFQINKNDIF